MEAVMIGLFGFLFFLLIFSVCSLLPAFLFYLAWGWLAPQFGLPHLDFIQVWVALFALGILGRIVFGRSSVTVEGGKR